LCDTAKSRLSAETEHWLDGQLRHPLFLGKSAEAIENMGVDEKEFVARVRK